jgi:hypothetical protein
MSTIPTPQFWFRSTLFKVAPDEDDQTNPFCYGRELAEWLKSRFRTLGYEPEEVIPEDWGWCVMLQRRPFLLWIGCANVYSDLFESIQPEHKSNFVPEGSSLTWTCFVGSDILPWQKYYWKRLFGNKEEGKLIQKVADEIEGVLGAEKEIHLTDAP